MGLCGHQGERRKEGRDEALQGLKGGQGGKGAEVEGGVGEDLRKQLPTRKHTVTIPGQGGEELGWVIVQGVVHGPIAHGC